MRSAAPPRRYTTSRRRRARDTPRPAAHFRRQYQGSFADGVPVSPPHPPASQTSHASVAEMGRRYPAPITPLYRQEKPRLVEAIPDNAWKSSGIPTSRQAARVSSPGPTSRRQRPVRCAGRNSHASSEGRLFRYMGKYKRRRIQGAGDLLLSDTATLLGRSETSRCRYARRISIARGMRGRWRLPNGRGLIATEERERALPAYTS